ncbi:hypothetical protein PAXINDRAFT_9353 [Paxillus involutus ATCC 200175]|nr:hypothetical protein PAXINDRAFT_9353 [Paxillus involutus ATCC 200175]
MPQEPETTHQTASKMAADTADSNATSTGPTVPDESDENAKGEKHWEPSGEAGEKAVAARGPVEGATDKTADGVILTAPASDDGGHTYITPNPTPPTPPPPDDSEARKLPPQARRLRGSKVASNRAAALVKQSCTSTTQPHDTSRQPQDHDVCRTGSSGEGRVFS